MYKRQWLTKEKFTRSTKRAQRLHKEIKDLEKLLNDHAAATESEGTNRWPLTKEFFPDLGQVQRMGEVITECSTLLGCHAKVLKLVDLDKLDYNIIPMKPAEPKKKGEVPFFQFHDGTLPTNPRDCLLNMCLRCLQEQLLSCWEDTYVD